MAGRLSVASRGGVQMRMRTIYQQEGGTGGHLDTFPSAPHTHGRTKTCQWIDGEPSRFDSCKCGAPVSRGVYCERHWRRAVYIPQRRQGDEL